jgi:hypothetical protein
MDTVAEPSLVSRARVPVWAPYLAIWCLWAFFQLIWGIPNVVSLPEAGWLFAIPMLLLPFNAGFQGPWTLLIPLGTPFLFVWLDRMSRPQWDWRSTVTRYAVVAIWFGLSLMLAPSSGIGVVWTGRFTVVELGQMFLEGWIWGFATLLIAAGVVSGAARIQRLFVSRPQES